jgi:hypothetical protein
MKDLLADWLTGKFGVDYQIGLSYFAGLAWAIWTTRNKMCIQKKLPNKLLGIVYLVLSYIQKWRIIMRKLEKVKVEELMKTVLQFVKEFKPWGSALSDVVFI